MNDYKTMTFDELETHIDSFDANTDMDILSTRCTCDSETCNLTIAHFMVSGGYIFPLDRMDILSIGSNDVDSISVATLMASTGVDFPEDRLDILFMGADTGQVTPAIAMVYNGYRFNINNREALLHTIINEGLTLNVAAIMARDKARLPTWDKELMSTYVESVNEESGVIYQETTAVFLIKTSPILFLKDMNLDVMDEVVLRAFDGENRQVKLELTGREVLAMVT